MTGIFAEIRRWWYSGKYRASNGLLSLDCAVARFNRVVSDYWWIAQKDYLSRQCRCIRLHFASSEQNLAVSSKQVFTPSPSPTWPLIPFVILYRNFLAARHVTNERFVWSARFKESSRHGWNFFEHTCAALVSLPISDTRLICVAEITW